MPPKYVLDPDYVEAKAGQSPTLHFTVTSEPPLASDAKHSLTHADGSLATKRFKVTTDTITFNKVRVADTGFYSISCRNDAGLVGKETLELEVTADNTPAPHTSQPRYSGKYRIHNFTV